MSGASVERMSGCDVCGREREVVPVSSMLGAFSYAICGECAARGAEPMWAIRAWFDVLGPPPNENIDPWSAMHHDVRASLVTWHEDRYMLAMEALPDPFAH